MLSLGDSEERVGHPRASSVEEELYLLSQVTRQRAGAVATTACLKPMTRRDAPIARSRFSDPKGRSPNQPKTDSYAEDTDAFDGAAVSSEGRADRHPERDLLRLRSGGSKPTSLDSVGSWAHPDRTADGVTLMDVTGMHALHELSQHSHHSSQNSKTRKEGETRTREEGDSRSSEDGDLRSSLKQIEALGISPNLRDSLSDRDPTSTAFSFRARSARSPIITHPQSLSSSTTRTLRPADDNSVNSVTFHRRSSPPQPILESVFGTSPCRFSPSHPSGFLSPRSAWWQNTPPALSTPQPSDNGGIPLACEPFSVPCLSAAEPVHLGGHDQLDTYGESMPCCVNPEFVFNHHMQSFIPQTAMDISLGEPQEKKKRRKYRRTKDCDLPKKPKTPYTFFQLSVMEQIWTEVEASEHAGKSREILSRLVAKVTGQRWRAMSPEDKKQFTDLAASDSERYKLECADYARKNPFYPDSRQLVKLLRGTARNDELEGEDNDEDAAAYLPHFGMMEQGDLPFPNGMPPDFTHLDPAQTGELLEAALRMQLQANMAGWGY